MSTFPHPTEVLLITAIGVFILSRVLAQRALAHLDDAGKSKLLTAASKSWWVWIVLVLVLAAMYFEPLIGVTAFLVFSIGGIGYNVYWVRTNDLSPSYVRRATISNIVHASAYVLFGFWLVLLFNTGT